MKKTLLIALLCFGLILMVYIFAFRPTTTPSNLIIPTTSLDKSICERVSTQFGDCKRILLFDAGLNLVFAESRSGIIPVLTNKEFTEFKKFIFPIMDFQEFKEEKEERGPIDWRAENRVQEDFSIIYGFAEDAAKTIVINSEGNIQPNRFYIRDNLWGWYITFQKDKVKLPVVVTVYDEYGEMIYGGNVKE